MSLVKNISNFEDSFHQIKNLIHAEIDKNSQSRIQNFQLKFSWPSRVQLIFSSLFLDHCSQKSKRIILHTRQYFQDLIKN